jgi:hypothetical protein
MDNYCEYLTYRPEYMKFRYNELWAYYWYDTHEVKSIVISQYATIISSISFKMSAVHILRNNRLQRK